MKKKRNIPFKEGLNGTFDDFEGGDFCTDGAVDYTTGAADDVRTVLLGYGLPNVGEDSDGGVFLRGSISAIFEEGESE